MNLDTDTIVRKRVTGIFDADLSVPIDVSPKLPKEQLITEPFKIEDADVHLETIELEEAFLIPEDVGGGYEPARLKTIRATMVREARVMTVSNGMSQLHREEEEVFERILVEAVERLTIAVALSTQQWHLDSRHPVHTYADRYFVDKEVPLNTQFPLRDGSKRLPRTIWPRMSWDEVYSEVSHDLWTSITQNIHNPTEIPPHDEFLYGARQLRRGLHYEAASLFAAVAVETLVDSACREVLGKKHGLTARQTDKIIKSMRHQSRVELLYSLYPDLEISSKEITKLAELRNKIAHGNRYHVTNDETDEAISIVNKLKRGLTK